MGFLAQNDRMEGSWILSHEGCTISRGSEVFVSFRRNCF